MIPLVLAWLSVAAAQPSPCARASSPVERAACANPTLRQADAALNRRYAALLAIATPSARRALRTSQRAWLVKRNGQCRTAALPCLTASYRHRQDQLDALDATVQDDRLDQIVPVIVRGSWRAGPIVDPSRSALPADAIAQLEQQRLPTPDTVVRTGPGSLCLASQPCFEIGWDDGTLNSIDGGSRLATLLKFPLSARTLVGRTGNKWIVHILLPRPNGTLVSTGSLCQNAERGDGCRSIYQVWTPASPDARVEIGD